MEETQKRRWLMILFFSLIGLLFAGFTYSVIRGPGSNSYQKRLEKRVKDYREKAFLAEGTNRISLQRGEEVTFDGIKLTYNGIEGNKLDIAVIILDLDPESAYRHFVPRQTAKKGFRLGGQHFKALSIGKGRVVLERIE